MKKYSGYAGKIAFIHLDKLEVDIAELPYELAESYIGGAGLLSKLLYDRIEKKTDPLSPKNVLGIMTGALTGTMFPQSSRFTIAAKNVLTGGWGESHAAGFFGPMMKFAGLDGIIVDGKAPYPVYIFVNNGKVELKDARAIWGSTTSATVKSITKLHNNPDIEVIAIGPAGENLVRFAAVLTGNGRVAARSGMGAVFGSKNLKAIAVYGTGNLNVADAGAYLYASKKWRDKVLHHPYTPNRVKYGTTELIDMMNAIGRLPTYNFKQGVFEDAEKISMEVYRKYLIRPRSDFACVQRCGRFVMVPKGKYENKGKGPEYECLSALGSRNGISDIEAIIYAHHLCDEYGMDTIGTGGVIAFVTELFERGILTRSDTGGIEFKWNDVNLLTQMIEKIARREGFGDEMAEGTYHLARKIGKDALPYAMHVKGQDIAGQEPRAQKSMGLAAATAARGADHLYAFPVLDEGSVFQKEIKEWYGEQFLPEIGDRLSPKHKGYMVFHNENYSVVIESLGVCKYGTMVPPALYYPEVIEALRITNGFDTDEKELKKIGERIVNINRLFNIREGFSRKDDSLPKRLTDEPAPQGPPKGQVVELDEMLDEYYKYRGWDVEKGYPTKEKLDELGLLEEAKRVLL